MGQYLSGQAVVAAQIITKESDPLVRIGTVASIPVLQGLSEDQETASAMAVAIAAEAVFITAYQQQQQQEGALFG